MKFQHLLILLAALSCTACAGRVPADDLEPGQRAPKEIFKQSCSRCHGFNARYQALGVSESIGEWHAKDIADALRGYRDGTRTGGVLYSVMREQAQTLDDAEIDPLADYIDGLNE